MINCGVQCTICDYPIHLDTYKGCEHGCIYCFANEGKPKSKAIPINSVKVTKEFIDGKRTQETSWCDWDIPLHWGANSDPFQACEREYGVSLELLQLFKDTQYPFIVSTKNPVLLTEEPYLSLISECNCVLQVSAACDRYDKLEPYAPKYQERLKAISVLSPKVQRIIIRVQPLFVDCFDDIMKEIPNYAKAGAYGVIAEGFATRHKYKGMIRLASKYVFPTDILAEQHRAIKEKCHENNLKYFCGEDRLRFLGDSLTCCGTMGLDTFKPTKFNTIHLAYDDIDITPTDAMQQPKTFRPFRSVNQSQVWWLYIKEKSFAELMYEFDKDSNEYYKQMKREWAD